MSRKEKTHFVYVIARHGGDDGFPQSPVKIGITSSLGARLRSIQTACPFRIVIVHFLAMPCWEIAEAMEKCFHHMQRANRLSGEWFDMEPQTALAMLLLYFKWSLELHGVAEDLIPEVLEKSGANKGEVILKGLPPIPARDQAVQ